jgi:hypothetical protein
MLIFILGWVCFNKIIATMKKLFTNVFQLLMSPPFFKLSLKKKLFYVIYSIIVLGGLYWYDHR